MPRLLDLEIGTGWLALRIVGGALLSALVFFFLSYVPLNLLELINRFVPHELLNIVGSIVSGLVHPFLPTLGAIVSISVFLEVLFRKTKAYGPILMLAGLASTLYVYFAFQGGAITLILPKGLTMGVQVKAYLDLTIIMLLCMLPTLLTVLKGAIISFSRQK
ncbi:MAG: hypothetical protein H5T34_06445 [Candidatus Methanomethyliales bacterium]|nr:hypothetical protein [Candidatus Methanomethylicales archaeon]